MTHNDTVPRGKDHLTPAQLQVLQGLLAGDSVTAAAKLGQVSRETVHRWLREDFGFLAAYNRGRRETLEEIQDTLLATARRAARSQSGVGSDDVDLRLLKCFRSTYTHSILDDLCRVEW